MSLYSREHRREGAQADEDYVMYPVPGYPGYYSGASGAVYAMRKNRKINTIAQTPDREGYPRVRFSRDGRRSWIKVARVVALSFLPEKPSVIHQVRHLDGNNKNNTAWNLKWGTPRENCADRDRHGTTARGSRHGMTNLDESKVVEMRALMDPGESVRDVATWFGVSLPTAYRIKNKVYWKCVP